MLFSWSILETFNVFNISMKWNWIVSRKQYRRAEHYPFRNYALLPMCSHAHADRWADCARPRIWESQTLSQIVWYKQKLDSCAGKRLPFPWPIPTDYLLSATARPFHSSEIPAAITRFYAALTRNTHIFGAIHHTKKVFRLQTTIELECSAYTNRVGSRIGGSAQANCWIQICRLIRSSWSARRLLYRCIPLYARASTTQHTNGWVSRVKRTRPPYTQRPRTEGKKEKGRKMNTANPSARMLCARVHVHSKHDYIHISCNQQLGDTTFERRVDR